jgi:hypothetical protein
MSTKLLTKDIWQRITALAKRKKGAVAVVAVAYCGKGARKRLPLKGGSLLVVDASPTTVRAGLTDPAELLWFFDRDVSIYSVQNLHAKVFVFGDTAIVGSTNVSSRSASILQEAAIMSRNKSVAAQCRRFIEDQAREPLERAYLEHLDKIPRTPRHFGSKASRQNDSPDLRLWIVPLWEEDWDDKDCQEADKARPQAHRKIRAPVEKLDEFQWPGKWFAQRLLERDLIVQVTKKRKDLFNVSPPSHVVDIKPYTKGANKISNMIVFLGKPKDKSQIRRERAIAKLGPHGKAIENRHDVRQPFLVRDPEAVRAILGLWPAKAPRN